MIQDEEGKPKFKDGAKPDEKKPQSEERRYEHDRKEKKVFRLRVIYNKNGCIASGHCILSDPYNFALDEEFRAVLNGGKEQPGPVKNIFIKEIETEEPWLVINAAKTCTPKVIAVIDMDTGKRIAP